MKKILLIINLLFCIKVKAIENITINNENLSPIYNSDIKVYNYYTYSNSINIQVKSKENEQVTGSGIFSLTNDLTTFKVISNDKEYTINVFKDYHKEELKPILNDLIIEGYNINFDTNIHEYDINIKDETNLNISYDLSNDDAYVNISGNGNFNSNDNTIKININNQDEYIIHVHKSMNVSLVKDTSEYKELSSIKKEIVILIIITISCTLVFLFYYSLFINKTTLHI
jgi:hypothetical protein